MIFVAGLIVGAFTMFLILAGAMIRAVRLGARKHPRRPDSLCPLTPEQWQWMHNRPIEQPDWRPGEGHPAPMAPPGAYPWADPNARPTADINAAARHHLRRGTADEHH